MFSIPTALIVVNASALVYWVAGYCIPYVYRRQKWLRHEERELSKSLARKI